MNKTADLTEKQLHQWMELLIQRAARLGETGEVPVTAVILDKDGKCIGHGSNRRTKNRDPLGHAELVALKQASLVQGDWRFNDCTLIVTLEPCPMCAGALTQARMGRVIFGTFDSKRGGLGGTIDLASHKSAHHHMNVSGGLMEHDTRKQLENWFKKQRKLSKKN